MHMQVAHDWLSENFFPFFWKFSFVAALQIFITVKICKVPVFSKLHEKQAEFCNFVVTKD